jgi:hypothetical protein
MNPDHVIPPRRRRALAAALWCSSAVALCAQQAPAPPPAGTQPSTATPAGQRGGGRGGQDDGRVLGPNGEVWGFTNLGEIPGTPWRIHDDKRPQPPVVRPGDTPAAPPADAIVLFDGKDLSKWVHRVKDTVTDAQWLVHDGIFESGKGTSLSTRESFGDVQLHVEFATPTKVEGSSQGRGNSGVIFMGRYEIQVLDSFDNRTYADGMAASIYGDTPPLVNVARKAGEWQTYDIVFEAPRFKGPQLIAPAYFTVLWNGVLVHNRRLVNGATSPLTVHQYIAHEPELPLTLQNHGNPVRFRNIWIRRLKGYDQDSR